MTHITLDHILEEAKALPPHEQRQLRNALNEWLQDERPEDRLEQMLYEAGLLSEIKPPISDLSPYHHRRPVAVKGRPLSEIIVEERR